MKKLFRPINKFFTPKLDGIDQYKYNILIGINWIAGVFGLFYLFVAASVSYEPGIIFMSVGSAGLFMNLFMIKYKLSYTLAANFYLFFSGIVGILGCTTFSGGLYSPVLPWLALMPITSILLLGINLNTIIWLVITSLCFVFFGAAAFYDLTPPILFDKSLTNYFFAICLVGVPVIFFFVTQVFENTKNNALVEVEESNSELNTAIIQLKDTQEQLVQQEKLASLGQLTAGIAHEIKNPLNFVHNFSQLSIDLINDLAEEEDEDIRKELFEDIKTNLTKIKHHGDRADFIVKSMLLHSRSGKAEFQETDINKICDEYLNLAFHGIRTSDKSFNCRLEKTLDPNLPNIYCMAQDISRVILNLLNNAMYAVKDIAEPMVGIVTTFDAKNIYIEIIDNGTGMAEETKKKLFEPFYTTKPTGQGTGLGLSISFDIIKAHGGSFDLSSTLGKGTSFKISLPIKR